ncbi:MAG: UDP-N-acetylmuramoyl-tripeptide--D-alanyl-D-alanine ligase [Bdellovibrionota bacterium]
MSKLLLADIISDTKAELKLKGGEEFTSVGTDTRKDLKGQLFIALKGDQYDAHDYLVKAAEKGAAGLLIQRWDLALEKFKDKLSVFLVKDTLLALQNLGQGHRRRMKAKIIGLTGSNGKTTTKEFTAAILSSVHPTHWNSGSFNNHWGVPLTLLQLERSHEFAVVEMGMNHAGEITELVKIAEPDIVVCTMVGRAHIEYFGSIEKIAEAKEEIYEAASFGATRVYNLDDVMTAKMYEKAMKKFSGNGGSIDGDVGGSILTFSIENATADVYFKIQKLSLHEMHLKGYIAGEPGEAHVSVFGKHNLTNLLAAATLSLAAGLDPQEIWQGLGKCKTNWGRNQWLKTKSGIEIIFDAYNANPDSMTALLANLSDLQWGGSGSGAGGGKKIGVFAQMGELGKLSAELHQKLGAEIGGSIFDEVFFYGEDHEAFRKGLLRANSKMKLHCQVGFDSALALRLKETAGQGDLVVVKGSRSNEMEKMILPLEPIGFTEKKE